MSTVRDLDDGWTLRAVRGAPDGFPADSWPATVPGSVHTDLMDAGLIPDPYLDQNEKGQHWIGLADWQYRTTLTRPEGTHERLDLVFDGLDTVATVTLGGTELGRTANMHRSYRFDITDVDGDELVVDFASPVKFANAASLAQPRPHVNHHPYNAIRKMACSFGWDWGLDTATSGIWRPARLEAWSTARLKQVLVQASVDGTAGRVRVPVTLQRTGSAEITVRVDVAGKSAELTFGPDQTEAVVEVGVPEVELWWPVGYGAQPLYEVTITLHAGETVLDETSRRVGFRSVEWNMTPDETGTPFQLVVNGRHVLVKGFNWIPDDAFPHRITRERYRERFEQMLFAHANLVRVWGGGIYEDDHFYDLADEMGLLTWQDFLMACAAYSEEEPLRSEVIAEARENVARLAHHASLVLLNGNNENLWGYQEWGWAAMLDGKTWGEGYYRDIFPSTVAELAPHVPYTPGSPFSPDGVEAMNDIDHGTVHLWDTWNAKPATEYLSKHPRFVAEFGWQGPPTWSTLTAAIHDDPLTPESPGTFVHQKANMGDAKLTAGLLPYAKLPTDMPTWHWAMSWMQANAARISIEHFRAEFPRCSGTVWWQINDCWPVISWAAVDGYGRRKPILYAMKHVYEPRLLVLREIGDGLELAVLNDTDELWSGDVRLTRHASSGEVLAEASVTVAADGRGVARLDVPADVANAGDAAGELVRAELDGTRTHFFFAVPRASSLAPADVDVAVDGGSVRLTARTLLRDAALLVDQIDPTAEVDDMLVTLLPGESVTLTLSGHTASAEELRDVLVSANDLL